MAWERRQRGGLYYTRSRRVGGRVVREYVGTSQLAEAEAALDAREREERAAERRRLKRERARHSGARDALRAFSASLDEHTARTLELAGFHYHRGHWRRRRAG